MNNRKFNLKMIKEMCGTVSFKKGDAFYRAGKVSIERKVDNSIYGTVHGTEDFHVKIEFDDAGNIRSTCSCPTLPGIKHSCQHVAGVLIMVLEQKKLEPMKTDESKERLDETVIENELMTLFKDEALVMPKSRHQLYFEKRQVLQTTFTLKLVSLQNNEEPLLGITIEINKMKLSNIRLFLLAIKEKNQFQATEFLSYDPHLHCFLKETDAVIHQLIQVMDDETTFIDMQDNKTDGQSLEETLLIPPSAWFMLMPLLQETPSVEIQTSSLSRTKFMIEEGTPPFQFRLEDSTSKHYELQMSGFEESFILNGYHIVFSHGKIYPLAGQDCERLVELRKMQAVSGEKYIPIREEQLDFFLDKVVPGLKRIGDVQIATAIVRKRIKTPLIVKLYLDRLRNRLLAGLEFHYDHIVIQPLENRNLEIGPMIIRDTEQELEILQIMEECGFTVTEGGYFMQNEELEYDFLFHTLPELQGKIQVYATTAVRNRIVKPNVFPKIRVRVQKERTDWLEFKFEMDGVGDKHIKELLAALEIKQKYYRLPNGSLLSLETKEMEEIQRFLNAIPIQEDGFEETLNVPLLEGLKFLDIIEEQSVFSVEESFRQLIEQLRYPSQLNFEIPSSLKTTLRDYQKSGFKWMKALANYGFGGVLADDMGLGKTIQSITFIVSELQNIRRQQQPVLIVCPSALTYNWLQEFMTFAPEIQTIVIDGNVAERTQLLKEVNRLDVVITSYPLLRKDIKWYEQQPFHTIFFDEAQAFKNPTTQTARTVKKLKANNRFGLTGTPIENSLEELWSIYHVVFPHLFQGLEAYSHLTRKAIANRVRPFLLRRTKKEVLSEIPQKEEILSYSELLPEQKKLYVGFLAKLRHETLKHLDKETLRKNKIRILAGITRLRQICCHPALFVEGYQGSSAKFEQLLQILEDASLSGRRVLIFSQFTKMLDLIGRELVARGQEYFYLDGQTPSKERVVLCDRFNSGERNVFLISLKAGGTGLNLTGADTVILYDLWWNPAVEAQAMDRAHRMGQEKIVQVIKLVSKGTIEEKMNELQAKKKALISDILNVEGKELSTITEEDIREILNLT